MKAPVFICLVAIVFLLNSCTSYRYIYAPAPANVPYFTEKGNTKINGFYSGSGNNSPGLHADGFDIQVAHALSNHLAITAAWFHRNESDRQGGNSIFDTSAIHYTRNLGGVGTGYFVALNSKKTITFNLYGGVDVGRFSIDDEGMDDSAVYSRYHQSRITKWYLQPSFNFMPGKYFRASLFFRNNFVHYGHIKTSYTKEELDYFSFQRIRNSTLYFFETGYELGLGIPGVPWLFLNTSLSFASGLNIINFTRLTTRSANISIGLSSNLFKIKSKE